MSRQAKLIDLYEEYSEDPAFKHLRVYTSGIKLVPGEGSTAPRVMVIGEAPGATENSRGRPFVGASGRVIREMIAQCGLSTIEWYPNGIRKDANAFITNVVKYRPPGNRTPTPEEIEASRPYLRKEWKIIGRPRVILTAGVTALMAILSHREAMGKVAGVPQLLPDNRTWLYPMYHPAFPLRDKRFRPEFAQHWNDFNDWLLRKEEEWASVSPT